MKLIIMRGLPASGKTTKAEEICRNSGGNILRVNRDLLRQMLHFNKWSPLNEKATKLSETVIVKTLLLSGYSVIVDDTNLSDKHLMEWKNLAKAVTGTSVEVISFLDVPYTTCIERDKKRGISSVGSHTIVQMAMANGLIAPQEIVICDIDGTVADLGDRVKFIQQEPKDWKSFFEHAPHDRFRSEIWERVKAEGKTVVFVSGRPDNYRAATQYWLERNGVLEGRDYLTLLMRRKDDRRPDTEVKRELFERYLSRNTIVSIYDDRPRVIRMWRDDLHLKNVIDVGNGIDF